MVVGNITDPLWRLKPTTTLVRKSVAQTTTADMEQLKGPAFRSIITTRHSPRRKYQPMK
jgi:hypothetical protein